MDNGDIGYTGYEYKGKATGQSLSPSEVNSFRNRDTGKLSNTIIEKKIGGGIKKGSTVMTQIAKQMNLDNEGQLKALLEEKVNSYVKPSSKKTELTPEQEEKKKALLDKYRN